MFIKSISLKHSFMGNLKPPIHIHIQISYTVKSVKGFKIRINVWWKLFCFSEKVEMFVTNDGIRT